MRPYVLIESDAQLEDLTKRLAEEPLVAVDTESNGYHAYFERVCLLQVSTSHQDYIVDMLAVRSPHLLAEIFADPGIEKIFHAAANDIGSLKRDFGFSFRNVFDTAIACKILGCKKLGLSSLLAEYFGVVLDKKWQRCNWGKRPLEPEQLHYARLDTHYLIPLRNRLYEQLNEKGLLEQAGKAFERVCGQAPPRERFPSDGYLRIRGAQTLSREARKILQAVYAFRDREARRRDRAPFRILSNEVLMRLASVRPTTVAELRGIKGMPKAYRSGRPARRLVQTIRKALEETDDSAPKRQVL